MTLCFDRIATLKACKKPLHAPRYFYQNLCLYIIAQANVTDELEERIEILEDTVLVIEQDVEELENEDALINVRLFDIEMDVFDNET